MYIYHFPIFVVRQPTTANLSLLKCLSRPQSRCETQLRSHLKTHLGKALLPSSGSWCQDPLLLSTWTKDLRSFLAYGQSLPSIPCNEDVSTVAASLPKHARESQDGNVTYAQKQHPMTFAMLYWLDSQVLPTLKREGSHGGMRPRGRVTGSCHRICPSQAHVS